jgi:hypothetical protein
MHSRLSVPVRGHLKRPGPTSRRCLLEIHGSCQLRVCLGLWVDRRRARLGSRLHVEIGDGDDGRLRILRNWEIPS